jgi:hypothetical protein
MIVKELYEAIDYAKKSTLIHIDEVIENAKTFGNIAESDIKELEEVKQEIENL